MKLRNLTLLLAMALSMATAASPRYIFYFIGDGMGMGQAMAAQTYNRVALKNDKPLLMMQFPTAGILTTYSASSTVTDSAAAGTALSCGKKTKNGMLGMTPDTVATESMAEVLHNAGWGVGLVTSVAPDDATPGAFYAHVPSRSQFYQIGRQAAESGYEFIAGSTWRGFPDGKGGQTDLADYIKSKDIDLVTSINDARSSKKRRVFLHSANPFSSSNMGFTIDSIPGMLTLPEMTAACIDHLKKVSPDRFVMMVEGGNIDHNIVGRDQDGGAGLGGGVYIRYAEDGSFNPITGGEGTFTMSGGTIGSNKAEIYGGGVYVNGSEFTMNGSSSINKNEAYHGAGVFIDSGANIGTDTKFTMNDGSVISENIASGYAGGVYVSDSNFIMNGNSSINKNKANAGASVAGGVYVQSANVIMNDNSIINENETEGSGGGVAIISGLGSTFAMNDNSAISKNKASAGGAVVMRNDSKFTMNDNSSINENTANVGSAVHMSGDSEFTMNESSSIINNIVKIFGGSVYFSGKVFNVSGAVVVADNTGTDDTSSNVNLSSNGKTVTVTGALTEGAAIGVTPYSPPTEGNPVTIAQGSGYTLTDADKAYFTSDNTDYIVDFDAINKAVVLRLPYTYTVTFDNNDGSTPPTTTQITVKEGQKVDETKIPDDPTKDGFIFTGWYKEAACTNEFDFETEITENTTVYAKWVEKVTIKIEKNDGTVADKVDMPKDGTAERPTDPTRNGYIFVGWYSDEELTTEYDFTQAVTTDITLYAKWQKAPNNSSKKYSISGTVKYQNGVAIQNAVVKANSITTVTDEQGKYLLSNLSSGVYDIIATITVDGSERTASKRVSLISGNVNDADIIFTMDDVSTEIKLPSGGSSGELDTGDIIVKGLDEEAKKHSEPDASVKLTLTIQSEDNDSNQEAKKAIQKKAKRPLITKPPKHAALLDAKARAVFEKDVFASDLYYGALAQKTGAGQKPEYRRGMVIL